MEMNELSDAQFTDRALARLPAVSLPAGFEAGLLAGYDGWRARRQMGLAGAARGLAQLVWPGAPAWAPAGALTLALLLGAGLGAVLPGGLDRMVSGFSLDRTPGFTTLISSDGEEDL